MKLARKLISLVLCLTLLLGIMPLSVLAEIGLPKGDYDGLILEFDSYNAMYEFREDNGGKELGGNMLLVDGTYSDAQRYDTMAHITSVTYNYTVEAASVKDEYATAPNDPLFEEQTYPNSTAVWEGIASVADNYEGVSLHDIRVGVIDSGIDATHEDLKNRVVAGYDAVNETAIAAGVNSDVALDSHGTKVAGLIAAESHNGIGIAGVSGKYPIQLVPLRALNENGNGKIADIIKAIYWAIDNNVDILNMSFGVRLSYYPAALANAVSDAYENGVFMVAAAGNEGNKTFKDYYPACLDNVRVAVSAAGPDSNEKAHYSNDAIDKGNGYVGFKYTGVCGTDLLTTTAGNGYDTFTGTSASCAVITGYYAMMLSLTGGRTNPNAYHDLSYVFQRAMAEGALFNYYNAKPDRLRSAILNYLDDDVLFANQNSIKSVLECDSTIVGNTTVTGRIVTGAHLVGDASLFVLDEWGSIVYRSDPVANDGSNPTEYTFPLSVMDFEDGEVEIQIRHRTKEEVENGFDSGWVANWACKKAYIKNSLVAKNATITLLDREGSEIYSTVYVVDLATNKLVHTIEWDQYSEKFENTIPKSMFNGGKLAFIAYGEGLMYYIESECKEEIVLGGDSAQMTTLNFVGATKTLKNAKIYSSTPAGMFQVGVTDENGVAEILMMEGDFDLFVVDEASRYIVSAHLSQDGDVLEATFADEIDGAEPYTLAVTSKLADNDYYSVGVSTQPVNNLAAAATLGWIPVTEPTIYVTPGTYYVQVGIYDTILEDSSISRYLNIVHGIGQVNLPADEIDFDPTVLIATTPVAKYELDYGDKQYITFSLIDDKGYAVYGGDEYYVGDEGTISDASKWKGYEYASTYDADGNEYNSVDVDEDWAAGTRDYFFTATGRYETLPAKDATYTVEIEMKNYTFSSDETGMLPYAHQIATIEFVVKVGKILRASTNEPETYNWVDINFVYAYIDGEVKMLTQFGSEYNESDDSFTLVYDARKLVDGTPIMVTGRGWNKALSETVYFYSIVDYDISNPNIVVTPPETGGKLWMTLDGQDIYGLQATIPYGDATFTFEMDGDNWRAYPVGEYTLSGFASIGSWSYEYDCYLYKYISIDTAITIAEGEPEQPIELFSDDMESVVITPYGQFEFQLSTIDENGVRGPITSVHNGGDTCMVLRTPGSKDVLLSAIPKEWNTKEALGYTVELDFFYSNVELPVLEEFASFEVMADQASFTAEEDVTVSLHTYVSDGLRLCDLFLMKYEGQMGEGGESSPGVVAGHYYPTIRYRQMGGEWSEPVAMDNWKSANLGKLAPGSYQACIEFAGVDEYNVPQRGQTCNFTVSGDMAAHEVHLDAPETAGEEVKISIRGNAGAEVTVSYTTPSGATKELDAITLPANGMGSVTVALTEEGDYTFSARSVLDGNVVNASPVTVACDYGVPEKVENFRATPEGSNALRLSWDVPAGATRVWLFRNGVTMGYVEAEYNSYLDKNLSLGSIYTYSIIPEGANGSSGEATFTTGQPVLEADVTAPTAPTALSVKSEKMSAVLSWTRSTDNVRVVYYYLYRDGEQIAILLKRNYVDDGLTKNTTYNYTVTAVDAEGNESAPSPVATLTTPANYELEVQVDLERGKTGVVTGEKLTINADAGRDANKVTAVIEYVSKDEAGVQTTTVDLTKAGLYWRADWKIQRVQEVKSIVVHSYEGETEVASKAAEGFPCLLSSAFNFTLTIHNAPYAKKALASAKIVLTDTKNGYKYSMPVIADNETCIYEFKGLSAGQYLIQVLWDNKTLYTAKNISVGTSAVTQHSADIDNFVRIKETIGLPMYHFFDDVDGDNIIGMDVLENQELTEDGYLSLEGDTAFYIAKDHRLVVRLPYSEKKNIIEYNDRLYDGYSVSESAIFYYTPGVYEFSTPTISDYTEIESMLLKLTDISNTYDIYLKHGEKMIADIIVSNYKVMSFAFDHPDTSWVRVPKMNKISVEIEGKEFYSDSGVILDKTVRYRESFNLEGDGPFEVVISPKAYTWKDVKFSVQAFYKELDTMHTFKGDIEVDVAYNERFIVELGDTHKVLVPPTGYITVRWRFNRSDRPANAEQEVTSFWHSVGIRVDEVTDVNGLVSCQMDAKLTKAYPHSMKVEFKDLSGFVDWSEVTATWVDARGMHTEDELVINEDGNAVLGTTVYLPGEPDPYQLYTQQVSFSSPYVNIATATVPLNLGAAAEVQVKVTDIKFQFNYDPAIDYFIAFYHDDETYNFKYIQSNQPTNSDRAAFNGDLDKTWNGGVTVPIDQVYTMHMVVLPISKWAETEDGYSTYYSYRAMSYEDVLPYAIFERTYTRDDLKADGEKRYYQLENKYQFRRLDMGDITLYDRDGNLMPTVEDGSTFLYIKQKSTGKYMLLKERNESAKNYWVEDVEHFLLVYLPPCIDHQFAYNMTGQVVTNWWVNAEGNILLNDIETYIKHFAPYCTIIEPEDISKNQRIYLDVAQANYEVQLLRSDGTVPEKAVAEIAIFDGDTHVTSVRGDNKLTVPACAPGHKLTAYVLWKDPDSSIVDLSNVLNLKSQPAVKVYELDLSQPRTEPFILVNDEEPVLQYSATLGTLDTQIRSVTPEKDGQFRVRLFQFEATDSINPVIMVLPEGAHDIYVDKYLHEDGREITVNSWRGINVEFLISAADFEADNTIEIYIENYKTGTRFFQFYRTIEYDNFSYGYNDLASTNDVRFVTPTDVALTNYTGKAYQVNIFGLQGTYGETFGDVWKREYGSSGGALTLDYSTDIDESMTWQEYIDSNPWRGGQNIGETEIYEGKWMGFHSDAEDFAIGIKVDDLPLIYTLPEGITMDPNAYGRAPHGYDEERGVYWINKAFLERIKHYRENTGDGMVFIPMAEPETYPHTYRIQLDYCYVDMDGVMQYEQYKDESIRIHHNAPVLKSFKYEGLTGYGVRANGDLNSTVYTAITSTAERAAFEQHVLTRATQSERMVSATYRVKAYFGEPDMTGFNHTEIGSVYAVATGVSKNCTNRSFELTWDEAEQCFVGVGILGDQSETPDSITVVYDLAGDYHGNGVPAMQLHDIGQNLSNLSNVDIPDNVEEVAPTNGWTLTETYEMWELYAVALEDGKLSQTEIDTFTDENGRLYLPQYIFHNEDGSVQCTRQDYIDFRATNDREGTMKIPLMDGKDYWCTLYAKAQWLDERTVEIRTTSDDLSIMLPVVATDDVAAAGQMAGIIDHGKIALSYLNRHYTGLFDYSSAGAAAIDLVSAVGLADTAVNAAMGTPDWVSDLTPSQQVEWQAAQDFRSTVSAVEMSLGFLPGVGKALSLGTAVIDWAAKPFEAWAQGKWEALAKANRELAKNLEALAEAHRYAEMQELLHRFDAWWDSYDEFSDWEAEYIRQLFENWKTYDWWYINNGIEFASKGFPPIAVCDPSGYVFEGYEENRLEDVTATLYYLNEETGQWVKWNSMYYNEGPNPNITGSDGKYGWDVTHGKWKVVYEKDGYYLSESAELDVPPPHMDVNIGLVSQSAATLKEVIPGKGGAFVDIVFDRPVLVEDAIAMLNVYFSGETVDGTISALNGGKTSNGIKLGESAPTIDADKNVACTFRFIPDEALEVGTFIHVEAKEGVETYNGMLCAAIVSDYVQVPEQGSDPITSIIYTGENETLEVGETLNLFGNLEIVGDLGDIVWTANNPEIATVDENGIVTAVSGGTAIFIAACGDLETAAVVVVNPAPHVCAYDQKVTVDGCLATKATEEAAATYYYACICGAIGTETYTHGEPLAHTHQYVDWDHDETDHWRVCACGDVATVGKFAHTWVDGVCEQCGAEQTKQELPIRFDGYSVSEDVNGLAFRFTIDVTGMDQKVTTAVYDNAKVMYNGQEYSLVGMGAIVSNDADAELTRENIDGVQTIDVFAKYLWSMDEDSASYAVRVIDIPENGKDTTVYARAYFVIEVEGEQVVVYADDVAEQTYNGVLNG